ncbi:MAG: Mg chelatase, subunit ChlI, partial [Parcubacteria group bacterium GW2011_GWE2_37_8]
MFTVPLKYTFPPFPPLPPVGPWAYLDLSKALFVGELALDGSLRHTNGILPLAIFARDHGYTDLFIPAVNAHEASLIQNINIFPVETFGQVLAHITGKQSIETFQGSPVHEWIQETEYEMDMAYIKGQEFVKRAMEIAAAGGHNILLSGPPGSGKTTLAEII